MEKCALLDEEFLSARNENQGFTRILVIMAVSLTLFIIFIRMDIPLYPKPIFTNSVGNISYSQIVRRNIQKMLERKEVIHMQLEESPIRSFFNIYSYYPTAPHYNLTACYIPKVLSTTLGIIFCYLSNSTGFKANDMNMETVYWANPYFILNNPDLPQAGIPLGLKTAFITSGFYYSG